MDYQQALDYLYSFIDPSRSGPAADPSRNLARTRALLGALGDPQDRLRFVVVAGTKGKGSTCVMIEAIARAAGLRVGLWTSPHLHTYRERIQVDRRPISEDDMVRLVVGLRPHADALRAAAHGPPSTFALGMGLALTYFAERSVDLVVLEVGLGGRYDSANVVTPLLSVITSISYDHMEFLGDTLAKIAADKAGILKPGVPGVTIAQPPEALEAIEQAAHAVGAPLFVLDDQRWAIDDGSRPASSPIATPPSSDAITWIDPYTIYTGAHEPALQGTFQRENARLAIAAALLLRERGLPLSDAAIGAGLAGAHWPARFEVTAGAPPVVIDGAHNGDSARRLAESLRERFPGRVVALVFGSSRDKDLSRMIPELAAVAQGWVLTRSGHPRAMADLAGLREQIGAAQPAVPIVVELDMQAALAEARKLAGPEGVVCVTGSLFVAALAREALGLAEQRDPPKT
jgi:dihydrofolate synthase/folylpolyglutamate synthase